MKPKEYVSKYCLNEESAQLNKTVKGKIANDLGNDFENMITSIITNNKKISLSVFNSQVDIMEKKFNSIVAKSKHKLSEGFWKFVWSTKIKPLKHQYCGKEIETISKKYNENY